ncbi:unnamed protein product [Nesidiocoris tenuis]|uniref:Uncharacterized protein n=1 Tax=Nesidiocoris tenuis TaxID=355587 RepID=A0A6H5FWV5_9HEMI|nr:unnamed protein product [Nesidiocoris tenuis]
MSLSTFQLKVRSYRLWQERSGRFIDERDLISRCKRSVDPFSLGPIGEIILRNAKIGGDFGLCNAV